MSETAVDTRVVGEGADAITYDVRGDLADATPDRPALMIIGSPMDAGGLRHPRGPLHRPPRRHLRPARRGAQPDRHAPRSTPEQHADDLHRVIAGARRGPGRPVRQQRRRGQRARARGAHPEDVRRLVAHEPPTAALLPDRERGARGVPRHRATTYQRAGYGPAMAKFIALVMYDGALPDDYLDRPAPDPAMFGMSDRGRRRRDDPLMREHAALPALRARRGRRCARWATGWSSPSARRPATGMAARGGRSVAAGAGHRGHGVPGRPRRLPRRRVRPDGRAGRVRRRPARRAQLRPRPPDTPSAPRPGGAGRSGLGRARGAAEPLRVGMPDSPCELPDSVNHMRNARLTVAKCPTHRGELPDSPW